MAGEEIQLYVLPATNLLLLSDVKVAVAGAAEPRDLRGRTVVVVRQPRVRQQKKSRKHTHSEHKQRRNNAYASHTKTLCLRDERHISGRRAVGCRSRRAAYPV